MVWPIVKFLLWGAAPAVSLLGVTIVANLRDVSFKQVMLAISFALMVVSVWALCAGMYLFEESDPRLMKTIVMGSLGTIVVAMLMAGGISSGDKE